MELPADEAALHAGKRLLLHFGAVDYLCTLFVNGQSVMTHRGGYLPFEADITPFLHSEDNELVLKVQDFTEARSQARGKQTLERGGIFYTAQSGIWQSVWMEWIPSSYIQKLAVRADYDTRKVTLDLSIRSHAKAESPAVLTARALFDGRELACGNRSFLRITIRPPPKAIRLPELQACSLSHSIQGWSFPFRRKLFIPGVRRLPRCMTFRFPLGKTVWTAILPCAAFPLKSRTGFRSFA